MLEQLKKAAQRGAGALYQNDYPRLIKLGAIARPNYAYIVFNAARLAKMLGLVKISVLEFGVAGGRGLINLEYHAKRVGRMTGVEIEVYGFDTGEGLPPPVDYRDLPYIWQEAHFKMDRKALEGKLDKAELVIGDVKETVPSFISRYNPAPIGAISFDLDYYSSTVDAFGILSTPAQARLPRILCYFDDIFSSDFGHVGDGVGVPLAIREFNANDSSKQLSALTHLEFDYRPARKWHRQIYSFADFDHPDANRYIIGSDRQLAI